MRVADADAHLPLSPPVHHVRRPPFRGGGARRALGACVQRPDEHERGGESEGEGDRDERHQREDLRGGQERGGAAREASTRARGEGG